MLERERNSLRRTVVIVVLYNSVVPLSRVISVWFHKLAGWPVYGIAPFVAFGLLSMLLTIQVAVIVVKWRTGPTRGLICMLSGTVALWVSLLVDAHEGVEYPMPLSITAALLLAVCWLVWAWGLCGCGSMRVPVDSKAESDLSDR